MTLQYSLGEICTVIAGQSPPSASYNKDGKGLPFFQGKADFGYLYPSVRTWCNSPNKVSEPNDILFSLRAPVGPTNLNNTKACIGRGLAAIRCGKEVNTLYLLHYLRANEKMIAALGTGSTFTAITIGTLNELLIPLPPLDQQKKIVAILDAADTYRQKTKALIAKYDELAQSLFLEMFGDLLKNSFGFDWETLKNCVVTVQIGPFGTQLHQSDYISGGIPMINPTNISQRKIIADNDVSISSTKYESLTQYHLKKNDVIMGRRGEMGRCALIEQEQDGWMCGTGSLFIRPGESINPIFLVYMLTSNSGIDYLNHNAQGVTMKNLNKTIIENIRFGLAPIKLQNQFAERVQIIESQKALAQRSLEKAEELFNSLLQRAFIGEVM